jgi:hypothetical protein
MCVLIAKVFVFELPQIIAYRYKIDDHAELTIRPYTV